MSRTSVVILSCLAVSGCAFGAADPAKSVGCTLTDIAEMRERLSESLTHRMREDEARYLVTIQHDVAEAILRDKRVSCAIVGLKRSAVQAQENAHRHEEPVLDVAMILEVLPDVKISTDELEVIIEQACEAAGVPVRTMFKPIQAGSIWGVAVWADRPKPQREPQRGSA